MFGPETLTTMMVLGAMVDADQKVARKVAAHRETFQPTVQRLTATALLALLELLAEEVITRYGEDDDAAAYAHREAMRREVRWAEKVTTE